MGAIRKAGVPFYVKVDTQKDLIGKPTGFKLQVINDADGTATDLDATFNEVVKEIDAFSTTTSSSVAAGKTLIPVKDASGFALGDVAAIGGNYYYINAVDTSDSSNNTVTLAKGLETAVDSAANVDKSGKTGIYKSEITIDKVGEYTVVVSNYAEGMENTAFTIEVEAANIDDVKSLLDQIKPEIDDIKSQVDELDETGLNSLVAKASDVQNTLSDIKHLVVDNISTLTFNDDETDIFSVGDELTGKDSSAKGKITTIDYNSDSKATTITLDETVGIFNVNETVNNGTDDSHSGIATFVKSPVDSVMEFVAEINKALTDGGSSLAVLKSFSADVEHMLKGDDKLEDSSANPTAGKGLAQIFDELVATHSELDSLNNLANDTTNGFKAIRDALDDARSSIEGKIDALNDSSDNNSLASKLNAIKSVVDANESLLENDTYGLSALKDLLDSDYNTIVSNISDLSNAVDAAKSSIEDLINNQTAHIDDRFDDVVAKLNAMRAERRYNAFV